MKEIGGYFEFELPKKKQLHGAADFKLNSGRNALQCLLQAKTIKKIYLPFYCCNSVTSILKRLDIIYEFYKIDENFYPADQFSLEEEDYLLYINYFGLCSAQVQALSRLYANLIVDNTQAFYAQPLKHVDTFYSPRKFFGVPDGGYLYTMASIDNRFPTDCSFQKMDPLLKRIELGAANAYKDYQQAEKEIGNMEVKQMSRLTERILSSIDYEEVGEIRRKNFNFLHKHLGTKNQLSKGLLELKEPDSIPMVYPLMTSDLNLRKNLIESGIYVATYWTEVLEAVEEESFEGQLVNLMIPLPVDQRYTEPDMQRIIDVINKLN